MGESPCHPRIDSKPSATTRFDSTRLDASPRPDGPRWPDLPRGATCLGVDVDRCKVSQVAIEDDEQQHQSPEE